MDEGAQVVIPDLDGEEVFLPEDFNPLVYPSLSSPGAQSGAGSNGRSSPIDDASVAGLPAPMFLRSRGRQGSLGSLATTDDGMSSAGTPVPRPSPFRMGSSGHGLPTLDYFNTGTPARSTEGRSPSTPFSFPVKKPSFASLRAAIKGQGPAGANEPVSPLAGADDGTPPPAATSSGRRGTPRSAPIGDVFSVSNGLAHVTGLSRPPTRKHNKSGSQASTSMFGLDDTTSAANTSSSSAGPPPSLRSPSRGKRRHAHHGSHISEASIGGLSISTTSSGDVDVDPSPYSAGGAAGMSPGMPLSSLPMTPVPSAAPAVALPQGIGVALPQTAMDYALNSLLARFVAESDAAIDHVLTTRGDAPIEARLGVRPALDAALAALAASMQHACAQVVDSMLAWVAWVSGAPAVGAAVGMPDDSSVLSRRRALLAAHLAAHVLGAGVEKASAEALEEQAGADLEACAFQLLHLCSLERERERGSLVRLHTTLQGLAFESVSRLLGALSRVRIASIGAQFVAILQQSSTIAASRENELLTEAAILGMHHLRITVYPMEAFEEGATFLDSLARFFAHAHGYLVKRALARVLRALLLPVARAAGAEQNHPVWAGAVRTILARAQAMSSRARYWSVAYPLWAAALCAAPRDVFLPQWTSCIDAGIARLRDRAARSCVLACAAQLLWVYLFRYPESTNPTTKRLDAFFQHWFPPPARGASGAAAAGGLAPPDVKLDAHVAMVHYALVRQFAYARPLVLDLLRQSVLDDRSLVHQAELLHPARMMVAIRAVARTHRCLVDGEMPPFPTCIDGIIFEGNDDAAVSMPSASDAHPLRGDASASFPKFAELIGRIALICDYQVKDLNVFDERVPVARGHALPLAPGERVPVDREHYALRTHAGGALTVAIPRDQQAYLDLLRTCFDSWPRCLPASLAPHTLLATLFRAQFSADPSMPRASMQALERVVRWGHLSEAGTAPAGLAAHDVLGAYMRWTFRQEGFIWEIGPHADAVLPKMVQTVHVFQELFELWWAQMEGAEHVSAAAWTLLADVETCGISLLCAPAAPLRHQAIALLRRVAAVSSRSRMQGTEKGGSNESGVAGAGAAIIAQLLDQPAVSFFSPTDSTLSPSESARASRCQIEAPVETLARLAEHHDVAAHGLWLHALPVLLRHFLQAASRNKDDSAADRTDAASHSDPAGTLTVHPHVPNALRTHLAGRVRTLEAALSARTSSARTPLLRNFFRAYAIALCATADSPDALGLVVPLLSSDDVDLRESAAAALSSTPPALYPALLDTLAPLRRGSAWTTEARGDSLAQVLARTAPLLCALPPSNLASAVHALLEWVEALLYPLRASEGRNLDPVQYRLRAFFCCVVARLYDAVAQLSASHSAADVCDAAFALRRDLFPLLRGWHSFAQVDSHGPARLAALLAAAVARCHDPREKEQVVVQLRHEMHALADSAEDAIASLCHGPLRFCSNMPGDISPESRSLLGWVHVLFVSASENAHGTARRALKALLASNPDDLQVLQQAVTHSFSETLKMGASRSFFGVLGDACPAELPLSQAVCLGVLKLAHPESATRLRALHFLGSMERNMWARSESTLPALPLAACTAGAASAQSAAFLAVQEWVATAIAARWPAERIPVICAFAQRLDEVPLEAQEHVLRVMPVWLSGLELESAEDGSSSAAPVTYALLSNLLAVTLTYAAAHPALIRSLWAPLTQGVHADANAQLIVHFLLQAPLRVRRAEMLSAVRHVAACIATGPSAPRALSAVCARLDPGSMVVAPSARMPLTEPAVPPGLYMADLSVVAGSAGAELAPLWPALVAVLVAGELATGAASSLPSHLPVLLHAVCVHLDGAPSGAQTAVTAAAVQVYRAVVSQAEEHAAGADKGIDEPESQAAASAEPAGLSELVQLFGGGPEQSGSDRAPSARGLRNPSAPAGDGNSSPNARLVALFLRPAAQLHPAVVERWGEVALRWAASGPVRRTACRSFEVLRALAPAPTASMLADMLARLAGTASDPSGEIQQYAHEILRTLVAYIPRLSDELLAQVYWATAACLCTVCEAEFAYTLELLDAVLTTAEERCGTERGTAALFAARRPTAWQDPPNGLQRALLRGLCSNELWERTLTLLPRVARTLDAALLGVRAEDRVVELLAATLPFCLEACDEQLSTSSSESSASRAEHGGAPLDVALVARVADSTARLAEEAARPEMARIATSVAKSRFRTKDDLARQAVGCLVSASRDDKNASTELATMLLGMTYNACDWITRQTLEVLRLFLRAASARDALAPISPPLLAPLLRLLSTPLAGQTLAVLGEPALQGPAAGTSSGPGLSPPVGSTSPGSSPRDVPVLGAPSATGWSVAYPAEDMARTRANLLAAFDACEHTLDVAPVSADLTFVTDAAEEPTKSTHEGPSNNLEDLAGQLHDLASFFGTGDDNDMLGLGDVSRLSVLPPPLETPPQRRADPRPPAESPVLERPVEQVAKILARSAYGARDSMVFATQSAGMPGDASASVEETPPKSYERRGSVQDQGTAASDYDGVALQPALAPSPVLAPIADPFLAEGSGPVYHTAQRLWGASRSSPPELRTIASDSSLDGDGTERAK